MSYEDILVERVESWIEVTIHRPEKLNALRNRTGEELLSVLGEVESDRAVGVVILKGSAKAFCTGVDTSEFKTAENEHFDSYRSRRHRFKVNELFRELPVYTKPVITAVEGYALGGGLELAMLGDIIVAGADAKFGLPETRLGIMPGGGGTQTLPRLIGKALAKELIWTGRRINAAEAREYRLVNHVTEAGKALDKARELARAICANAPLAVMVTKAAINRGLDMPLAGGMSTEGDLSFMLHFSKDRKEGLAAFREKRPPDFKGE